MTKAKDSDRKYSDALSDLKADQLMCRLKGHSWKHVTDKILAYYRGEPKQIRRDYRCTRCSCNMEEVLHIPSFDLVSRKYYYEDGYLLSKKATDGVRLSIQDVREETLIRSGLVKSNARTKGVSRLKAV